MKTLLTLTLMISSTAYAWGPTGHRVVGEVAERFMDAAALSKARKLLGGQGLARVSTWADEIKSEPQTYQYTFNWHYTDWPADMHEHNEENSSGLLLTSINEQLVVLKDPNAGADKKAFALKFLVHLVGDLHMPLHVGNGLDQGGNACKVLFHNQEYNLHALWDEGLINFTKLSYTELAKFVAEGRSLEEIREWKKGKLTDWARESKQIRPLIYPADVVASKEPISQRLYCRMDTPVSKDEMPKLGYEYSYQFMPVLEKRLFQAGLRLAVLLNEAL